MWFSHYSYQCRSGTFKKSQSIVGLPSAESTLFFRRAPSTPEHHNNVASQARQIKGNQHEHISNHDLQNESLRVTYDYDWLWSFSLSWSRSSSLSFSSSLSPSFITTIMILFITAGFAFSLSSPHVKFCFILCLESNANLSRTACPKDCHAGFSNWLQGAFQQKIPWKRRCSTGFGARMVRFKEAMVLQQRTERLRRASLLHRRNERLGAGLVGEGFKVWALHKPWGFSKWRSFGPPSFQDKKDWCCSNYQRGSNWEM